MFADSWSFVKGASLYDGVWAVFLVLWKVPGGLQQFWQNIYIQVLLHLNSIDMFLLCGLKLVRTFTRDVGEAYQAETAASCDKAKASVNRSKARPRLLSSLPRLD